MKEKVEILTASELRPIFNDLEEIKTITSELKKDSIPMFHGKRFLTDTALGQKLNICKRTLATYRANGILAYYTFPEKYCMPIPMWRNFCNGIICLLSDEC